jgi:hypothetical protein
MILRQNARISNTQFSGAGGRLLSGIPLGCFFPQHKWQDAEDFRRPRRFYLQFLIKHQMIARRK